MRISDWSADVCSSDLFIDPRGVIGRIIRHMVEALASAVDVTFDAAVGTRRRVARLLPLDVPPLPGWCERSGPHADAVLLRLLLGGNVVGSVLPIGRSEERRVGKEWVSQSRYLNAPDH